MPGVGGVFFLFFFSVFVVVLALAFAFFFCFAKGLVIRSPELSCFSAFCYVKALKKKNAVGGWLKGGGGKADRLLG